MYQTVTRSCCGTVCEGFQWEDIIFKSLLRYYSVIPRQYFNQDSLYHKEAKVEMAVESENYYKDLDPILDEVNQKFVMIDKEHKKKHVELTYEVVDYVIKQLKDKDAVFNKLYSRKEFVGSFYDGLRVREPTEFDINLIMKMPLDYNKILVENMNVIAGFVSVNISNAKNYNQLPEIVTKTIDKWCDSNGFLLENKVREWMEGVIFRCLGSGAWKLCVTSGQVEIKFRKSGPAFTLSITSPSNVVDVDLVFAIEFSKTKPPPGSIRWPNNLAAPWVVVPKPSTVDNRFWRVSFSQSEKQLIHQQYKLKFINRILKAFRDAQTNIEIPSYYIKTLFLWEAHKCIAYNNSRFWEKRQGYLFVHMLKILDEALYNKKLPYYWHKNLNLFNKNPPDHLVNMANQIKHIICKINDFIRSKDVMSLKNYILGLFTKTLNSER